MKILTGNEIRKIWIDFFKANDHFEIESASLVPINDNSLLWINSGVATLKNYFSGKTNPPYHNLVNSQKCIRTNDITNVGKTSRHHTFFEMLGNFSIGGYFKEKAIDLAYDLLINHFGIEINKLYFTVFEEDTITYDKWLSFKDINPKHVIKCKRERNFWDVGSGPCGPCTEIYYDRGLEYDPGKVGEKLFFEDLENDRYIEIWNIVFSEFNNDGNDNYTQLQRKNIDTGAGLERLTCISQNVPTNFDTDLFQTIIKRIEKFTHLKYDMNAYFTSDQKQNSVNTGFKIVADHIKACVFAIADGVIPSNKERGYIIRRLIRICIAILQRLNIEQNIFSDLVDAVIEMMKDYYPYLLPQKNKIIDILANEYVIFNKTLDQARKIYDEAKAVSKKILGEIIFKLVESYGFPLTIIELKAREDNVELDLDKFNELFKQHQKISNARHHEIAMNAQNGELLNLTTPFEFLYDENNITAKIVKLYDENFNSVEHLTGSGYVVFDRSCFYATSGGQLHDTGCIDKLVTVTDVIKGPNLQHIHHVDNAFNFTLGSVHTLSYDLERRMFLTRNHTVEHLIHAALGTLIDSNIKQEGAFKSPEKVTFDFQYHKKLTPEELHKVEQHINDIINQSIPVETLKLTLEEAQAAGAKAYFEDVYKKIKGKLRIIKVGDISCELCGGTHVENTKDIEVFKIISFTSKAAGAWRVEAITSHVTLKKFIDDKMGQIQAYIKTIENSKASNQHLKQLLSSFNAQSTDVDYLNDYYESLHTTFIQAKAEFDKEHNKQQMGDIKRALAAAQGTFKFGVFKDLENKNIANALTELINEDKAAVYVAFNQVDDKMQYLLATNEQNKQFNLNRQIKILNEVTNGKGGGKPNFVQGGCTNFSSNLQEIIVKLQHDFKTNA